MTSNTKRSSSLIYGMAAGLLTCAVVSLIGMVFQVEPHVITQRAIVGAAIMTLVVWVNAKIIIDNLATK